MHWTSCGNQQVVEVILVAIHGITPREVIMFYMDRYIWQVTLTSRDGGTASSTEVDVMFLTVTLTGGEPYYSRYLLGIPIVQLCRSCGAITMLFMCIFAFSF